jgi:hypothetical protein
MYVIPDGSGLGQLDRLRVATRVAATVAAVVASAASLARDPSAAWMIRPGRSPRPASAM